jgi:hypothetical protein
MKKLCDGCGRYSNMTPEKFLEESALVKAYNLDSRAIFLPFKIEELEATDIGPVKHFKTQLGDTNIISGGNSYGKSSIFIAIKSALTRPRPNYLITYERKKYSKKSMIRIVPEAPIEEISVRMNRGDPFSDVKCIVADPDLPFGDGNLLKKIFSFSLRRKIQLILFCIEKDFPRIKGDKIKVIRLPGRKK